MKDIFVLLDTPAITVLREITQQGLSDIPVVRAIVDRKFGEASIVTTRPQDETAANILRLAATRPDDAMLALADTKGVVRVSTKYGALIS
jgi:methionyl-tRNA formyltransferase